MIPPSTEIPSSPRWCSDIEWRGMSTYGWFLVELRTLCLTVYLQQPLEAQMAKNLPAIQETQVQPLGHEDSWEKGIATHSGNLENSMDKKAWQAAVHGSQRAGHDWAINTAITTLLHLKANSPRSPLTAAASPGFQGARHTGNRKVLPFSIRLASPSISVAHGGPSDSPAPSSVFSCPFPPPLSSCSSFPLPSTTT